MKKSIIFPIILFIVGTLFLSACASEPAAQPTAGLPEYTQTTAPIPTEEPVASDVPIIPTPTEIPEFPCDIAFDSDQDGPRDIYSMAPDGSNLRNLTNHPADDHSPTWSPDGTRIAFVSNRGSDTLEGQFIFSMLADGSDVLQISHQDESQFPDWSPTGEHLVYTDKGDIFLVDLSSGREINLTQSPEHDEQAVISPDGQQIAWLRRQENNFAIFVMQLDGSDARQITFGGEVHQVKWSVDGRIFAHWDHPDGICFNCVITPDGLEVIDAGGKGSIQEFLPFWTLDGNRVELVSGDVAETGSNDIFLVSPSFPEMFLYLTDSTANERNPDTAYRCGPARGVYAPYKVVEAESETPATVIGDTQKFVIGITGSLSPQVEFGIDTACAELDVQCVKGNSIADLAAQGVNAIVNSSNRWDVLGSYPQIHDAASSGIPIFMLNADSNEPGVYNLSVEHEVVAATLRWIFQEMGGEGKFVYYNFGDSQLIQEYLDAILEEYPGIDAIKKPADYNGVSFSQQDITELIASDPDIEAIWSTEKLNDIFWGIKEGAGDQPIFTECMARRGEMNSWKEVVDAGVPIQCMAHIRPGGMGYEGVYVAYYYLSGLQFKPDAFTHEGSTTLRYDIPVITNENLSEWLGGKLDGMMVGDYDFLQLSPLTPEEIREKWFVE